MKVKKRRPRLLQPRPGSSGVRSRSRELEVIMRIKAREVSEYEQKSSAGNMSTRYYLEIVLYMYICNGSGHRSLYISSSSSANKSSSGKSPTVTLSVLTKTACFGVHVKNLLPSTLPSPFPVGSSNSTPTHTPPLPIGASPTNRIVPRLANASSPLCTSHRAPTAIESGIEDGGGAGQVRLVGTSANRPSLFALRCERTVSRRDSYSSGVSSNFSTADRSLYSPGRDDGSVL